MKMSGLESLVELVLLVDCTSWFERLGCASQASPKWELIVRLGVGLDLELIAVVAVLGTARFISFAGSELVVVVEDGLVIRKGCHDGRSKRAVRQQVSIL